LSILVFLAQLVVDIVLKHLVEHNVNDFLGLCELYAIRVGGSH